MRSRRPTTLSLCAAILAVAPLACTSNGTSRTAPTTSATRSGPHTAEPATSRSRDDVTFGYVIEGDSGKVAWKADLVSSDGGGAQQPVAGTWILDGEPRWQLFTSWIDRGTVSFTLEGAGAATVSLVRGRAKNPNDPTAGIDVIETVKKKDLTAGASVTFEFP